MMMQGNYSFLKYLIIWLSSLAAALLRRGAMYEVTDHEGKTPLMYAIEKQNADIVTL